MFWLYTLGMIALILNVLAVVVQITAIVTGTADWFNYGFLVVNGGIAYHIYKTLEKL